jgi:Ca2+-binding RTX toxin-like protein
VDTYDAGNFGFSGFLDPSTDNVGSFTTLNEIEGMGGSDIITGNGNTRIAFYSALDGVTVDLSAGTAQGTASGDIAGVGTDNFTGVNAVRGSGSADSIFGDAASNTLDGQGRNDIIQGREGADTLIGGSGSDHFVFAAVSDSTIASHDTITDFVHATDIIDVSAISGISAVQGLISGATQVAAHSIAWIQSGANAIIVANNSGSAQGQGSADMEIVLTGVTANTLSNSDFFHV